MSTENNTVQFRGQRSRRGRRLPQELRIEGLNASKFAREGLKDKLREITSCDEKAAIFSVYQRGEIEKEVARVFLGDHLDTMATDSEEVRAAIDDTSDLVRETYLRY